MNIEKFTDRARGFLQSAQTVALRMNHQRITPIHLLKALLEEFLSACDLVKFARFEPSQGELQGLLDTALRFIDETAPIEAPTHQPEQKAA